jgi:TldD protein
LKDLLMRAMDLARSRGAQYADARIVHTLDESILVRNGVADAMSTDESIGIGVRVLAGGAWGFASSRSLSAVEVDRVTALALRIAQASALVAGDRPVDLGPPVASRGSYATPVEIDPFGVSVEDKLGLLLAADEAMRRVRRISTCQTYYEAAREHKLFANSEGAFTEQTIVEVGGGILATAVGGDQVQRRSYPAASGHQQVTGGWEAILAWDLPGHSERIAGQAVQLLSAAPCPHDIRTTVVLAGDQVALQVHESCGHPVELDRVYGSEAALAGSTFLTPDKLHSYRYGSELVNITADAVQAGGLGTFGWDDEGAPAQTTPVVKEGLFVGYLMSRETASRLGLASNGCMRAAGWNAIPLIRMTNVSLEPGTWALDELIADTDEGLYLETNRSWSIDDKRYSFHFGTEIGYEIRGGKLGRMLRDCSYTGVTPEFWNACDAVCNGDHWAMSGTPDCGKGSPLQVAHTSHGAAPARFRNVRVGVI